MTMMLLLLCVGAANVALMKGADGRWLIVADMDRPYRRS